MARRAITLEHADVHIPFEDIELTDDEHMPPRRCHPRADSPVRDDMRPFAYGLPGRYPIAYQRERIQADYERLVRGDGGENVRSDNYEFIEMLADGRMFEVERFGEEFEIRRDRPFVVERAF